VLDYGIGNLRSAQKALQHVGADAVLTADPKVVADAAAVVLPGVGAFGRCAERDLAYYDAVERARAVTGVGSATVVAGIPFGPHNIPPVSVPGMAKPFGGGNVQIPVMYGATPDYLKMMDVALVGGRLLTERDGRAAPKVLLVNESMARYVWPGQSALASVWWFCRRDFPPPKVNPPTARRVARSPAWCATARAVVRPSTTKTASCSTTFRSSNCPIRRPQSPHDGHNVRGRRSRSHVRLMQRTITQRAASHYAHAPLSGSDPQPARDSVRALRHFALGDRCSRLVWCRIVRRHATNADRGRLALAA
jgi:hypothetical protein